MQRTKVADATALPSCIDAAYLVYRTGHTLATPNYKYIIIQFHLLVNTFCKFFLQACFDAAVTKKIGRTQCALTDKLFTACQEFVTDTTS